MSIVASFVLLPSCRRSCSSHRRPFVRTGKSDPYLEFAQRVPSGEFVVCHKTEVIKNTLDPFWKGITVPISALCNGDAKRPLEARAVSSPVTPSPTPILELPLLTRGHVWT